MASASGFSFSPQQAAAPWPSVPTGGTIPSPQVGQRTGPDSSATEGRTKRMRLGHEDPVTQASRDWLQILIKQMEKYSGTRSLNDSVEIPRYKILRDACSIEDGFYIVLHQLFCGWSWDTALVHNVLAPHVPFEAVDHAFSYMQVILRNNQSISPVYLEWFANFPGPLVELPHTSPQCLFMSVVGRFLHQMSTLWGQMVGTTEARQFPLLVSEMRQNLSCISIQMQSLLFTTSRRTLHVEDGPLAISLNEIFAKDRASEIQIAAGHRTIEEARQLRGGFAQAYVSLMQAFRQQQLSNQNNVPSSTMHGFTPVAQRNLPAQPFPILPHPQSTLPTNSAAPSPVLAQTEAQMASRRASGPAVLGSSAPRGNMHVQNPNASTWAQIAPEPPMTQASQNIVNSPAQIHQPLTLGSAGAISPFTGTGYVPQGMPTSRGVNSNSPAQGIQRRASSFQQQPTQTGPAAQGAPAYIGHSQGLQYPQRMLQPPNVQPMTQTQVHSGQSNQAWSSQYPNPARSWPQATPAAGGHVAQPMAPQHQAQRGPPPIQLASSHPSANHPAMGYPVPQSLGLVRPLSEMEIHPNEYAVSPYGQPSLEMGLHQVSLRSPRRIPAQPVQTRYYQYVKTLESLPVPIKPQIGLQTLCFNVPEDNIRKLTTKRDTPGLPFCAYFEGSYRYRLRLCMRPDQGTELEAADWAVSACYWPRHIFINVNSRVMGLSRKQHFHKDLPLELTDALVPGQNAIRISLPLVDENIARAGSEYLVAVELVETRSHGSLRAMIENAEHTSMEETKEKMIRRLRPSDSDDIIVEDETLLVSLADPFSATMVETPVRGLKCLHLECFDLETWLQTRPSKPAQKGVGTSQTGPEPSMVDAWKCPICDLDARPTSLRIDGYFVQVRKELVGRGETNTKAITITADGKWTAVLAAV
ncbi:hypothetical protein B0J13DRAFT_461117 [Dactylonectria estremocensis]|uniref:SP-RING-type domain-containing protein n=1 Tax=Dactylonectria estremocensis TaxID=1079267 RepID=A0A9P9D5F6_9HYPO|nr:hypothetical protein B0J13DRAFT_461117 [Dactylonectria estremocensis]